MRHQRHEKPEHAPCALDGLGTPAIARARAAARRRVLIAEGGGAIGGRELGIECGGLRGDGLEHVAPKAARGRRLATLLARLRAGGQGCATRLALGQQRRKHARARVERQIRRQPRCGRHAPGVTHLDLALSELVAHARAEGEELACGLNARVAVGEGRVRLRRARRHHVALRRHEDGRAGPPVRAVGGLVVGAHTDVTEQRVIEQRFERRRHERGRREVLVPVRVLRREYTLALEPELLERART